MTQPAILALEDGTVFEGISVGAPGLSVGEVVFNTAMTGYQEILTDPSYARQLVTLTYPHIGNTGCTDQDDEAAQVWAAGLIVRDVPRRPSNWRNQQCAAGVAARARRGRHRRHRHPQADAPAARPRRAERRADGRATASTPTRRSKRRASSPASRAWTWRRKSCTRERYAWRDGQLDLDSNAFVAGRRRSSTSSPTTSA